MICNIIAAKSIFFPDLDMHTYLNLNFESCKKLQENFFTNLQGD